MDVLLAALPAAALDGGLIVPHRDGRSDFESLRRRSLTRRPRVKRQRQRSEQDNRRRPAMTIFTTCLEARRMEIEMAFPEFFAAAPRIVVSDPLARFLGAGDGTMEYGYADAVRLAGHSCPTVASAYLMTRPVLRALYRADLPERGAIGVELAAERTEGVAGAVANVACLVTGAAGDTGFKGIGPRFDRRSLLAFGAAIATGRCDSRASIPATQS
jgi:hypothetical protein